MMVIFKRLKNALCAAYEALQGKTLIAILPNEKLISAKYTHTDFLDYSLGYVANEETSMQHMIALNLKEPGELIESSEANDTVVYGNMAAMAICSARLGPIQTASRPAS